jgi:hypothetical protein
MTKFRVEKRRCWSEATAYVDEKYWGEYWGHIDGSYFYASYGFDAAIYHALHAIDEYSNIMLFFADQTDRVAFRK